MEELQMIIDALELFWKVKTVARKHGCNGNLFDNEQRSWRDPTHEEKWVYCEIFRELANHEYELNSARKPVNGLIWNAVMNSDEFRQDLSV